MNGKEQKNYIRKVEYQFLSGEYHHQMLNKDVQEIVIFWLHLVHLLKNNQESKIYLSIINNIIKLEFIMLESVREENGEILLLMITFLLRRLKMGDLFQHLHVDQDLNYGCYFQKKCGLKSMGVTIVLLVEMLKSHYII